MSMTVRDLPPTVANLEKAGFWTCAGWFSVSLAKPRRRRDALRPQPPLRAARPLRAGLPGVWHIGDVNRAHRRKATSFPFDMGALLTALEIGLLASLDGSCFDDF